MNHRREIFDAISSPPANPTSAHVSDSTQSQSPDTPIPVLTPPSTPTAVRWAAAVLVLAGLGICLHLLRYALLPFVAAGGLMLLLSPLAKWLRDRGRWPHWLAALATTLLCLAVFTLIIWGARVLLIPTMADFFGRAPTALPRMLQQQFPDGRIHWLGLNVPTDTLPADMRQQLSSLATAPNIMLALGTTFSVAMGAFLALLLTAYFLFTGDRTPAQLLWVIPPSHRLQASRLASQIVPMLRRYVAGVLLVTLYAMLLTWLVTHFALHLQGSVVLSVSVGLLELIPILGPILSLLLVGAAVAVQHASVAGVVGFAVFAITLRLSIDQIIGPLVLGKFTSLPPPVIILAFLVGGILFGAVGVVLAVPAAAVVKIVLMDVYEGQKNQPRRAESSSISSPSA